MDLLSINGSTLVIMEGNGDGTFTDTAAPADENDERESLPGFGKDEPYEGAEIKSLSTAYLDGPGDRYLDLVAADLSSHRLFVFRGAGGGEFNVEAIILGDRSISSPWDASVRPVLIEDFNGDGLLDLATVNEFDGEIAIVLGNADGTFGAEQTFESGGKGPGALSAGDVDGDGNLDLIVGNRYSFDVSIMLGDGTGAFALDSRITGAQEPPPTAVTDLNGDGVSDRAVADDNTNEVAVEIGIEGPGGRLVAAESISSDIRSTPILADLDADGVTDSVLVNLRGDVLVRMGKDDGGGPFDAYEIVNPADSRGKRVPARDVVVVTTAAGTLLAAVNQQAGASGESITLYGIDSDGRFATNYSLGNGLFPTKIGTADLDGDGQDDLVLVDGAARSVSVFLADVRGRFSQATSLVEAGEGPGELVLVDVAGPGGILDGRPEIVVANAASGDVSVLWNDGQGAFDTDRVLRLRASDGIHEVLSCDTDGRVCVRSLADTAGVAAADFNGDGMPDLVLTNRNTNRMAILFSKPSGGFVDPVSLPTQSGPTDVRSGDFDHDGYLDLAILNAAAGSVSILLGSGGGNFRLPYTVDAGDAPTGLAVADLNGDEHLDLAVGNQWGDLLIVAGDGTGKFAAFHRAGNDVALDVGDFNGDGRQDSAVVQQATDTLTVWLADGDEFKPHLTFGREDGLAGPRAVDVADLNGDGRPDLIVTNTGANNILVFLGTANGSFESPQTFAAGMSPIGTTVADLDADGRLDLVVANELSNDLSVWMGQADADVLFAPGPRPQLRADGDDGEILGLRPVSIEATDYDHDGHVDLIVSNAGSQNSFLFPGRGGGFFGQPVVFEAAGQILVGQFSDSRNQDLLIADPNSVWLQMFDGSSPGAPTSIPLPMADGSLLLANDFNGDGRHDLAIIGGHDGGGLTLLSMGDGTFLSQVFSAGLSSPLVAVTPLDGKSSAIGADVQGTPQRFGVYQGYFRPDPFIFGGFGSGDTDGNALGSPDGNGIRYEPQGSGVSTPIRSDAQQETGFLTGSTGGGGKRRRRFGPKEPPWWKKLYEDFRDWAERTFKQVLAPGTGLPTRPTTADSGAGGTPKAGSPGQASAVPSAVDLVVGAARGVVALTWSEMFGISNGISGLHNAVTTFLPQTSSQYAWWPWWPNGGDTDLVAEDHDGLTSPTVKPWQGQTHRTATESPDAPVARLDRPRASAPMATASSQRHALFDAALRELADVPDDAETAAPLSPREAGAFDWRTATAAVTLGAGGVCWMERARRNRARNASGYGPASPDRGARNRNRRTPRPPHCEGGGRDGQ